MHKQKHVIIIIIIIIDIILHSHITENDWTQK